ncbi:MAG TPA: hypothetical protein VKK61_05015 [Tepidisphaeraceae bacterium]|nr:hypothetical protein [Tepidisphaeraceae bacterium]
MFIANGATAQSTRPGRLGANQVVYGPFGTPGIDLKPFTIDHRRGDQSLINLSFLLDAHREKLNVDMFFLADAFIEIIDDQLHLLGFGPDPFFPAKRTTTNPSGTALPLRTDP